MEVFGLGLKIKEEGAATVEASLKRLGVELAKTVISVTAVSTALNKFVTETADAQREQAQLAAVLRSTNGVSGQTIESLNAQAEALVQVTAFTGGAISEAQALLLTFTNVRGVFEEATKMTLDLAQALGMDAKSAAMMLGKALNDPVLGVTTLRRAGVQLSESQTQLIAKLVESGNTLEAQRIILKELETQVGGSAEAYRDTLGGAIDALTEAFNSLFEANEKTGRSLTNTINAITDMITALRGPIQFVFTALTNGLVVIASLVAQVGLAITRFFSAVGAAAVTFAGAFGVLLPVVGDNIGKFIDDLNEKVDSNDKYFSELQTSLRNWRNEVVLGTSAADKLNKTLGAGKGVGGEAGGTGKKAESQTFKKDFDVYASASESALKAFEKQQAAIAARGPLQIFPPNFLDTVSADMEKTALELEKLGVDVMLPVGAVVGSGLSEGLAQGIEGGVRSGLEAALASGNIGDAFKAMGQSIIQSMAKAMVNVALQAINFAKMLASIQKFMAANPLLALAAATALLLAARAAGGGSGTGNTAAVGTPTGLQYSMAGTGNFVPIQPVAFGSTSASTAVGMQPRTPMNVTVIGPNDPNAQRAIQELMRKADSRGRIG